MSRHTNGPAARPALHSIIEDGFNRRDADAVVAAYEDDAMLVMPPDGDLALGREAIRAVTAAVLALEPAMTLAVVKSIESDEIATTHIRWRLSVTSPAGDRRKVAGRGMFVSRRRSDGSWGIVLDDLGLARPFRTGRTSSAPGRQHRSAPTAAVSGSSHAFAKSIGRGPRGAALTASSRLGHAR